MSRRAKETACPCEACGEANGPDETACQGCGSVLPWRGGWGDFLPGEQVRRIDVKPGDILLEEAVKTRCRHILRVTEVGGDWFSGEFADPRSPELPAAAGIGPFRVYASDLRGKASGIRVFRAGALIDPDLR